MSREHTILLVEDNLKNGFLIQPALRKTEILTLLGAKPPNPPVPNILSQLATAITRKMGRYG